MTKEKQKGFTLVELLTVIAIIAVLAGLLMPTIGSVQQKARKSQASSMISSLSTALKMYENDFGVLPTSADFGSGPTDILYLALGQRLTGTQMGNVGPYMEFKSSEFNASDEVLDPWGNPYYYYPDDDGGAGGNAPYNNQYSFDIYSMGEDGVTGSGSSAGTAKDDINNW